MFSDRINRIDLIYFTGCGVRLEKRPDEAEKTQFCRMAQYVNDFLLRWMLLFAFLLERQKHPVHPVNPVKNRRKI